MDCYYSFNHLTTSELVSEVTLTLYTNIHILLAMTDSDTQLEEEMEELSVQEADTGPLLPLLVGTVPRPQSGGRRADPGLARGRNVMRLQKMELASAASSSSIKPTEVVKLEAPPEASVSAADDSSLPRPESPRTRELKT